MHTARRLRECSGRPSLRLRLRRLAAAFWQWLPDLVFLLITGGTIAFLLAALER